MGIADQFFDGVETEQDVKKSDKPFWMLPLDDPNSEKDVLNWLNGELEYLLYENSTRFQRIQKNLAQFKGIQYVTQETRSGRDTDGIKKNPVQKIVTNEIFDLIENRSSKLVKYRPAVSVLPGNEDFDNKIGAKACDELIQHIQYQEKFDDDIVPEIVNNTQVMDEGYLWITWDEDKGDYHPAYKKAKQALGQDEDLKVPLLDDSGNPQLDETGNPIMIEKAIKVGDVKYEVVLSADVLLEKKQRLKDVNYCFRRHVYHVEEARATWPDSADKIKSSGTDKAGTIYDYEKMEARTLKNEIVVWEFRHKKTKFLPSGRTIWFYKDAILETKPYEYSNSLSEVSKLPFCRLPGIRHPGELHSRSVIEKIRGLTGANNNLLNIALRSFMLAAHPKWMMPAGAAKIDSLGNDFTVVQFKGPIAPQLISAAPINPILFEFRNALKEEAQQKAGIASVSRGEPPQGIKAGIALQFLQEQESERNNGMILGFNAWVREVSVMTLEVCADFYHEDDERMVKIFGKTGRWISKKFDVKHLKQKYDIRIQNSSALPQQRSARAQYLLDLSESPQFQGLLPPEQILEMLDLAQSDKFIDSATVAVRAAEAENDSVMNGEQIAPPEEFEDLVKHWNVHNRLLQDWAFKYATPVEVQQTLKDHVKATEMLMWDKGEQNPAYFQMLSTLQGFPLLFTPPQPDPTAQMGMPGANDGTMSPQDAPMPDGKMLSDGGSAGAEDAQSYEPQPEKSEVAGERSLPPPTPSVQDQINQNSTI